MPLSEEENRLLEQMERALAEEDPKLASAMRGRTLERSAKVRTVSAAAAFVVGIAALMGGAMTSAIWLSILGFVIMLASATVGLTAWRGRHAVAESAEGAAASASGAAATADPAVADTDSWRVIEGGRGKGRTRRSRRTEKARRPKRQGGGGNRGGFMQRMEHRWDRRRNQGY